MEDGQLRHQLDLTGIFCPQVVLRVREKAELLAPGTVLEVLSTDPLSAIDIPLFAMKSGHALAAQTNGIDGHRFSLIVRGGNRNPLNDGTRHD